MEGIEHKTVNVNGISMHVAELGKGPLVLFLHGFPELWYSWRHQLVHLASHGYRAVAPDLRGYGDTTGAPTDDPTKFTSLHVVADIVELINALAAPKEEKVFVVAHDWGGAMALALCLYRPDKVKAAVILSIPLFPKGVPRMNPVDALRAVFGDDFYICRFQKPGEIEAEFAEMGAKRVIKKFLTLRDPGPLYLPKGKGFGDSPDTPIILPSWLSEEEVDYYTSKFEKTGFTGGVNYYRAIELNWELTAAWTGAKVKVPSKFIIGDSDLCYNFPGTKECINNNDEFEEIIVIEGAAHFIQQERADEINEHILNFLQKF